MFVLASRRLTQKAIFLGTPGVYQPDLLRGVRVAPSQDSLNALIFGEKCAFST